MKRYLVHTVVLRFTISAGVLALSNGLAPAPLMQTARGGEPPHASHRIDKPASSYPGRSQHRILPRASGKWSSDAARAGSINSEPWKSKAPNRYSSSRIVRSKQRRKSEAFGVLVFVIFMVVLVVTAIASSASSNKGKGDGGGGFFFFGGGCGGGCGGGGCGGGGCGGGCGGCGGG